jgi:hypothetical protein
MDAVESQLQHFVAEFAVAYLFVHAGVVEWNGAGILLPGSSMAGKSTLVTALVDAGATYYSDEYAVLDDQGRVHPYRRPISLREGPLGPAGRLLPNPDPSHPLQGQSSATVNLVLLTTYRPGASWSCERVGQASGIMAMCEHTVAIQSRPADTMATLAKIAEVADIYQGTRGDLETAVAWIRDFVCRRGNFKSGF